MIEIIIMIIGLYIIFYIYNFLISVILNHGGKYKTTWYGVLIKYNEVIKK